MTGYSEMNLMSMLGAWTEQFGEMETLVWHDYNGMGLDNDQCVLNYCRNKEIKLEQLDAEPECGTVKALSPSHRLWYVIASHQAMLDKADVPSSVRCRVEPKCLALGKSYKGNAKGKVPHRNYGISPFQFNRGCRADPHPHGPEVYYQLFAMAGNHMVGMADPLDRTKTITPYNFMLRYCTGSKIPSEQMKASVPQRYQNPYNPSVLRFDLSGIVTPASHDLIFGIMSNVLAEERALVPNCSQYFGREDSGVILPFPRSVSYTHLTLPTNREV